MAWFWLSVSAFVASAHQCFAWFMSVNLGSSAESKSGQGNYSSPLPWLETRISRQAAAESRAERLFSTFLKGTDYLQPFSSGSPQVNPGMCWWAVQVGPTSLRGYRTFSTHCKECNVVTLQSLGELQGEAVAMRCRPVLPCKYFVISS